MSAYRALYEEGVAAQEAKSYDKALECYYKVVAEDEAFPALYNNMAVCMKAKGQVRQALSIMAKAARLLPQSPEIVLNYARLLVEQENWVELEYVLIPFMAEGHENPEALFLTAKLHFANKNYPLAYEAIAKANQKDPEVLHYVILLTACLYELERIDEATKYINFLFSKEIYDTEMNVLVIALLNSVKRYDDLSVYYRRCGFHSQFNEEAQFYYGQSRYALEDYDKAEEVFTDLIKRNPESFNGYRGLGVVKMAEQRLEEAEEYFKKAIELKPDCPEIINNYGLALLQQGRLEEAEKVHLQAIEYDPTRPEPWVNLATLYIHQRRYRDAVAANLKAIEIRPSYLAGTTNLIGTLREMGETEKAQEWLKKLFQISPDNFSATSNSAFLNLMIGNLDEGWKHYESRKLIPEQHPLLESELPPGTTFWEGEDLTHKRIFISSEQGIGDEFLFASCFHDVIDKAAYVVIECEQRLVSLFQRSFAKAHIIPRSFYCDEKGRKRARSLERLQPHLPLHHAVAAGTLPRYLRRRVEDFPKRESFIIPHPDLVKAWDKMMSPFKDKLKVGLCWRSGNLGFNRKKYYLDLELFKPLFHIPNIQVFNLQYGADAVPEIEESGQNVIHFPDINLKDDFENVAAMMMHLDVIVSAATAMGELAGALGRRLIRFEGGPDWTRLGQPERPWYTHITSLRRIGETEWEPQVAKCVELLSAMQK